MVEYLCVYMYICVCVNIKIDEKMRENILLCLSVRCFLLNGLGFFIFTMILIEIVANGNLWNSIGTTCIYSCFSGSFVPSTDSG